MDTAVTQAPTRQEPLKTKIPDKEIITLFIDDCRNQGLSPHTIEGYHSTLNLFSAFLKKKGTDLLNMDRDATISYIATLRKEGIHFKTIKNRCSAISSFCDYCIFENRMDRNYIREIQKRYIKSYKKDGDDSAERKLVNVDQMSKFVNMIPDKRDKAITLLFAKTAIRRRELVAIDMDDINWTNMSITLKKTAKRSNRVVFFDHETALTLKRWISWRETIAKDDCKALFVSYDTGKRLNRNGVYNAFVKWAIVAGLHDPHSNKMEDHFTPHCSRHWLTTTLRKAGMERSFIQELRGDARKAAIDVYDHIDKDELRKSYLAHVPQLGVE